MKLFIIVLAVVFAVMSGGGDKSLTAEHRGYSYPDELLSESENNVDLTIFRCSDNYICCTEGGGWISTYIGKPDGIDIPDGGFMSVNADITRYYGGVKGFRGNPNINRIHKSSPLSFDEAVGKGIVGDYVPGLEIIYNRPLKYSSGSTKYCIINYHGTYYIYSGGKPVGTFATTFEAEAAMGVRKISDTTASLEQMNDQSMYVFRCGDTYLAHIHTIFWSDGWTPLLNADFENKPTGFTLKDGEAVLIRSDLVKVNGGDKNYVNAPMLIGTPENVEEVYSYDLIVSGCGVPPFWGEYHSTGKGNEVSDWIDRASFSEHCNAMFDRYNGTWLVFFIDGKYRVYHEEFYTHEKKLTGVYDTEYEVEQNIGRNGEVQ